MSLESRRVEGRRLRVPIPFLVEVSQTPAAIGTGKQLEIPIPDGITEIKGLHILADTNQTIQGVYHGSVVAANKILPALAGAADYELSLLAGSSTKDMESVFGAPCHLVNKLIVVYDQATSPQAITAKMYGRKSEILG
jgi:hypothetical protein